MLSPMSRPDGGAWSPTMKPIRLLVISGSERSGSFNRALARVAAGVARREGATVTEFDLRALGLPLYDGDIEARGVPLAATQLRDALLANDALLAVTPEYNAFPTPLLLNAFDWLSRLRAGEGAVAGLEATANKPAGLLSASPGPLGGLRAMNYLRQYLQSAFAMIVVPKQFALGRAGEAFDESGALKDPRAQHSVEGVLEALGDVAAALKAARAAMNAGAAPWSSRIERTPSACSSP
jgi:NAD(P)H-dependent FMN reductase